jgi:hypothetical protein
MILRNVIDLSPDALLLPLQNLDVVLNSFQFHLILPFRAECFSDSRRDGKETRWKRATRLRPSALRCGDASLIRKSYLYVRPVACLTTIAEFVLLAISRLLNNFPSASEPTFLFYE